MKKLFMALLVFLFSAIAFAKDVNITIYPNPNSETKAKSMQFIVIGKQAQWIIDNEPPHHFEVENSLEIPAEELEDESRMAGETLVGATAYSLNDGSDQVLLAVLEGESKTRYLALITMRTDILGSTKNCAQILK